MTTTTDLSASLSHLSAEMSSTMEMLRQMNAILDRMNGVSRASSSSRSASTTSAPTTTTTTMMPAEPTTPAASSVASTAAPLAPAESSAASSAGSPKCFAPTSVTTPSSARATAVVPTPTTASTPPTTAVAISFRLPTPPFLTAKKKIAKMARREQRIRTAVFGAACAKREACTAAEASHAAPFASCRARASVRLRGPHHHGRLRPRRRGSGAPRPRVRAGRGRLCRHRRGDGVLRLWVRPGRARLRRHSHEDGALRPQAPLLRRARTVVSMASCLKLPTPTAFRALRCSRRPRMRRCRFAYPSGTQAPSTPCSSRPRTASAPRTASWASSPTSFIASCVVTTSPEVVQAAILVDYTILYMGPAAVAREALEVFDEMSSRYITILQPPLLIADVLLSGATKFHEGQKQFGKMIGEGNLKHMLCIQTSGQSSECYKLGGANLPWQLLGLVPWYFALGLNQNLWCFCRTVRECDILAVPWSPPPHHIVWFVQISEMLGSSVFAHWDPGGSTLQLLGSVILHMSCHFICVLLEKFWTPVWMPTYTFEVLFKKTNVQFSYSEPLCYEALPLLLSYSLGHSVVFWIEALQQFQKSNGCAQAVCINKIVKCWLRFVQGDDGLDTTQPLESDNQSLQLRFTSNCWLRWKATYVHGESVWVIVVGGILSNSISFRLHICCKQMDMLNIDHVVGYVPDSDMLAILQLPMVNHSVEPLLYIKLHGIVAILYWEFSVQQILSWSRCKSVSCGNMILLIMEVQVISCLPFSDHLDVEQQKQPWPPPVKDNIFSLMTIYQLYLAFSGDPTYVQLSGSLHKCILLTEISELCSRSV